MKFRFSLVLFGCLAPALFGCGDDQGAASVPPNLCGNGEVDPGEECDDGNRQDGDQCSALCKRGSVGIDIAIRTCPRILALSVVPAHIPAGEPARVSVTAEDRDGDTLSIQWVATTGKFVDATLPTTEYFCAEAGAPVLAVAVRDALCGATETIAVTCL
jgi:cysteine-rich repeat protein